MGWEGLAALLGILAFITLAILPIVTFILVLNVRRDQSQHSTQLTQLLARAARAAPAPETPPAPAAAPKAAAMPPPMPPPAYAPGDLAPIKPEPLASKAPAPEPPPMPPPPKTSAAAPEPGAFQVKAQQMLRRIWNWIVIGEEYRTTGASWEFAVATNWLLRLGIVIGVIGIGFFLKYSIEHGWLGPQARVTLSVVTGLAMLTGGVRLLGRPYQLLGQGLIGGGLATLYFSLYAACNYYHLLGVLPAFALMALVTLSAGVVAVRFNMLLIAVLGILGGFGTPLMLNTGVKNFPGLFGYLLLLGLGLLGISRCRPWPLLNYLGMLLTYGLAGATIHRFYTAADCGVVLGFLFAFFLLYAAVLILRHIVQREKITLLELLGSLAHTLIFFGLAYRVITLAHPEKFAALLTLALAAFYLALAGGLLVRRQQDRGLLCLLLALAALFLALTPPLALSRQWVTASWALQGLIMLWLAGKLDSRFLGLLACAAYLLAAARLAFYDFDRQFAAALPPDLLWPDYLLILGERLVAMGVPIAALGGAWRLLRRPPARGVWAVGLATLAVALLFLYLTLELHHTCGFFAATLAVPAMTLAWFALGLFLLAVAQRRDAVWALVLLAIAGLGMLGKVLMVDLEEWSLSTATWLYGRPYIADFVLVRLLDFALCLGLLTLAFARLRGRPGARPVGLGAGILALALLFLYLTLELNSLLAHFLPASAGGGITLLWAVYALTLLSFGLLRTVRGLRYAGLALFAVVVAKVFLSDLANLDPLYRIIAFIVLGVILLIAALIYLKFRQRFQSAPPPENPS
ncbi:MAG: DUF2339 domain-containing protein [Kiritimatiellaeota bacterium]|nr:DUF2339 domain-containing protein [Kiritimatiellota bacterium]